MPQAVPGGSPDIVDGTHGWGWGRVAKGDLPPLTADDIASRILSGRVDGVGVFCGQVSGNLEMIEVEGRAVGLLEDIRAAADRLGAGDLLSRLTAGCVERSPSGGLHYLLRVSDGPAKGNTKLANRPDPDVPGAVQVLAETRGAGGWFVAAPSAGRTHKSGGTYAFVQGGPETIPAFTAAERDRLHDVFRCVDAMPAPAAVRPQVEPLRAVRRHAGTGVSPGDDFAARTTWHDILVPAGWTQQQSRGDHQHWSRPGKSSGTSATTTDDVLYVFTASSQLPSGKGLGKFAAYAHLHHGGDFAAAARELWQLGYGARDDDQDAAGQPAVLERVPAPTGDVRSLSDYRADLVAAVTTAVTQPGLHLVRAPTGSGKSTATAAALRDVANWLMVLPDHANVQERVADLVAAGVHAVAYPKATAENCANLEEFDRVQRLGLIAGAVLCPTCPFKDGCPYRAEVKAADKAPGRVGTHERLRRSAAAAKDAQVVVIDEAPESVIAPTLTVSARDIVQVETLARSMRDHWYSSADDDQRDFAGRMLRVVDAINRTCAGVTGQGRTTVQLEGRGSVPKDWQRQVYRMVRYVGAGDLEPDALQLVTRAAAGDLRSLEVVTDVTERTIIGDDGQRSVSRVLHHYVVGGWRPAIGADAAVILLDATADAGNVAAVAGRDVVDRTPPGRLEGQHPVVQVPDDITRGASSRTVAGVVDAFLHAHPEVQRLGIIGHQHHVRDLVGTPDAPGLLGGQLGRVAMSSWFGAGPDRASNRWHVDCDHVLVLGTPRVNPGTYRRWLAQHNLEDAAQLEDGGWGARPWQGTTVDGQPVVVERHAYLDPSWDAAYRAGTTAALLQAVGRGRSLLADGVPVTVFTNDPLGLPVAPPVDVTPAAVAETMAVVTDLLAAGARSAKTPIWGSYSGNCASGVRTDQVVTALVDRLGIRRRAAQLRIGAAVDAGRLTRPRRGWVQLPSGEPTPPTMPQDARPVAAPTGDTPALAALPAVQVVIVHPAPPPVEMATVVPQRPDDVSELAEERAAIMEYDGGLPRLEAERQSRLAYGLPPEGDAQDWKTSLPVAGTVYGQDDDQVLTVGVDHAAVGARCHPFVSSVLDRFPGVVRRVSQVPPRQDDLPVVAGDRCRCGCTDVVEVVIHQGRSTRLDCARCDRFRRFGNWYERGPAVGPGTSTTAVAPRRAAADTDSFGCPVPVVDLPAMPGGVVGSFLPTGP